MTCKPLVALALCIAAVQTAHADPLYGEPGDPGYTSPSSGNRWHDPEVQSGIGVGVHIGGGVGGFTDPTMRGATSPVGGMWSCRGVLGTRIPLGVEVAYRGTANTIEGQLGRGRATLLGTTLESTLRYNPFPRDVWTPYLFVGVGWQRYSIDDREFQLSDTGIANRDDLVVIPFGGGFAYHIGSVITELRGTFHAAYGENLVLATPVESLHTGAGAYAPMHTWDASFNVGYEF